MRAQPIPPGRSGFIITLFAGASLLLPASAVAAPGDGKMTAKLQQDFLKLKFGMFLHFKMATYTGEERVVGYRDPSTFNSGGEIDTDQWADAAKAAASRWAFTIIGVIRA